MNTTAMNDLLEPESHDPIDRLRHSTAHLMAHAIQNLHPGTQFGIGPTIENGFYYDVKFPDGTPVMTPEDLPKIEKEMQKLAKAGSAFVRKEHPIAEALALFEKQIFKVEIIQTLKSQGATSVSSYTEGNFVDLCRGPHVEKTSEIKHFKLLSIAGAYWRGNEKNPQLIRIYGTAFPTKEELDGYLFQIEEAKKRDHRKLGKELDLFSFHPEAPGSPFIHPKGTVVYNLLQNLMRKMYRQEKYDEVITPQILDVNLWHKSGHYENYRENMYFTEVDERQFALKPMNCPAHTFLYSTGKRSYRDLPLRFADFGRLHRYERSGVLAGLTRVRSFCQDDAHIFCTPDQIAHEMKRTIQTIFKTYEFFKFTDMKVFLATRPEKRVGADALWDTAENALRQVLDQIGHPYKVNEGDGAFYGPKIDFNVRDALGRYHQLSTLQLDFNLAARFDLEFVGPDNKGHTPVVVHRAVLGSIERFMGVLIEHLAGVFPFWLAPVQARVIPIKDTHLQYCESLVKELRHRGMRVELDARNESMGLKTREAQMAKIPFSLVAGDREMEAKQFAVRAYGSRESQVMSWEAILESFTEQHTVADRLFSSIE